MHNYYNSHYSCCRTEVIMRKRYLAALALIAGLALTGCDMLYNLFDDDDIFINVTVAQALTLPIRSDTYVRVTGIVGERLGNSEYFWFSDDTGRIRIEFDRERWSFHPNPPVLPGDRIRITRGEIDRDSNGNYIEVYRMRRL